MSQDLRDDRPLVHVAEYLPVKSYGQVLSFMLLSMQVYRNARKSDGYVSGGITAKWWAKKFWTLSVWEDRDAMLDFVHTQPHANAAARLYEFAAPGACYVEWVGPGPADWGESWERLKTPTRYFVPRPL